MQCGHARDTLDDRVVGRPVAVAALLAEAATWADRIVDLMVVFLVQTVIVPVGGLWLTWRIARWATSAPSGGGGGGRRPV